MMRSLILLNLFIYATIAWFALKPGAGEVNAHLQFTQLPLLQDRHAEALSAGLPAHLAVAQGYVGVRETGRNTGPEVDRFLASVGHNPGFPWCAAFTSYVLDQAGSTSPTIRSARSRSFVTRESISIRALTYTGRKPQPGWIAVWERQEAGTGHTDFVEAVAPDGALTLLGGNIRLRDGSGLSGVTRREHRHQPLAAHRITHFTPVVNPAFEPATPQHDDDLNSHTTHKDEAI